MKLLNIILFVCCLNLMLGCDGYVRTLRVNTITPNTANQSASTTILINDNVAVTSIVSEIAAELGMFSVENSTNTWRINIKHNDTLTMYVNQEPYGWEIKLFEWPTFQRSDVSRKAEQLIRERLNK